MRLRNDFFKKLKKKSHARINVNIHVCMHTFDRKCMGIVILGACVSTFL